MATTPVLLTRPRPESQRFAAALGVPCEISPLLRIEFTGLAAPEAAALLFTSANGVGAWVAGGGATGLPVWCVGTRTADAAREAGFEVRGIARDADALVASVPDDAPSLLRVRGEHARGCVARRLADRGLRMEEAVMYRARALPLTDRARALAVSGPVVAPIFSPRSAQLLSGAWPQGMLPHLKVVAMSGAVAAALPVAPVAVAARPDAAAMREATLAALGC